jgi:hypothetical protein
MFFIINNTTCYVYTVIREGTVWKFGNL